MLHIFAIHFFLPVGKRQCYSIHRSSLASHTLRAKKRAEGSGDCAYNDSFHSPAIDGEAYFVCTAYETLIVNTQILRYNYK